MQVFGQNTALHFHKLSKYLWYYFFHVILIFTPHAALQAAQCVAPFSFTVPDIIRLMYKCFTFTYCHVSVLFTHPFFEFSCF